MQVRRSWLRAAVAFVAAAGIAIGGAVADAVADPVISAPSQIPGVPVHGQLPTMGLREGGDPAIISLHGVHRVEGGTVVYYSLGFPPGADPGEDGVRLGLMRSIGGLINMYMQGRDVFGHCDVAVIDAAGGFMYTTMPRAQYPPYGELCSAEPFSEEVGQARVTAVAVAPLPDGVDHVDVAVRGTVFMEIPVQDGPLEPFAEPVERGIVDIGPLVGTGWPELDWARIAATDATDRIYPITQSVQDLRGEILQTQTTLELAGDVLFEWSKADINAAGRQVLDTAIAELKERDLTGTLHVIGHTDNTGAAARNKQLSIDRAEAVATVLRAELGSAVTIETEGRGPDEPIASNKTDSGRALNRRVTIDYSGDPL